MAAKKSSSAVIPVEIIQKSIVVLRGQRVILDADLATLYGVTTKVFNQQIKRNRDRFPKDFMFQIAPSDASILRSQFVTSSGHGGRRYLPYVFTEHGAIMAATVLNSPKAVSVSIFVVRAFVQLREMLATHHQLGQKFNELERKLQDHDDKILTIIDAIRELMVDADDAEQKPPVGFQTELSALKPSAIQKIPKRG